jgi:hypothetical protein
MAAPGMEPAIRVSAEVSAYEAAMREISASTARFGEVFAASMRGAALSGRDFDDTLRSIALRISSMALSKAFQPLDDLMGSLVSGALGQAGGQGTSSAGPGQRGANITFNVQSPDAAGFRKSENQIASMLARAVGRGGRGL